MTDGKPTNVLTYAELSTILAALNYFQRKCLHGMGIAPHEQEYFADVRPLTENQIHALCHSLNCGRIVKIEGGPKG